MLCQRAHAVTGCITDYAFPCDANFLLHLWGINLASIQILKQPKQKKFLQQAGGTNSASKKKSQAKPNRSRKKKKKAEDAQQFFKFWKLFVFCTWINYTPTPLAFQSQIRKKIESKTLWSASHICFIKHCSIFEFLWLVDFECWHGQQLAQTEKKYQESRKKIGRAPQSMFKRFCLSVQFITGFHYLAAVNWSGW